MPNCTNTSARFVSRNARFPTEVVVESNSAQVLRKSSFRQPLEAVKSHPDGSHPDNVQTEQLGGAPASLLAIKHAKRMAQRNIESCCGVAARLPQPKRSCRHSEPCAASLALALRVQLPQPAAVAASYTLAQCALSLLEGLRGRLPLAHANWLRVASTGGSCRHTGRSCSAAAAQRPEGQEDRTKIRALIYEAVYHPDPLLGVAEHRGDVQQQRGAQATVEDMDHDRLHVWGLRTTGARCGLMLCCGMAICVGGEYAVCYLGVVLSLHVASLGRRPIPESRSCATLRCYGGCTHQCWRRARAAASAHRGGRPRERRSAWPGP